MILTDDAPDGWLSAASTAARLGLSKSAVYQLARKGKLPPGTRFPGAGLCWRIDTVGELAKARTNAILDRALTRLL